MPGGGMPNKVLSMHRAEAVRSYFVNKFYLSPDIFEIRAKGEEYLIYSENPFGPGNRRVEVFLKKSLSDR
uniref:OmpA family protein n=1 Tax=Candidatus Kentrum sp. TUN TaxID=2126343 RepID=A0A450ZPA7_9GAMM|nr:MAG: OmpA family protein [Candidatus Kentron sp. TUN]VFK55652.1 MAG: OmpA family protein [Candidatus Kentron sp. TUN]